MKTDLMLDWLDLAACVGADPQLFDPLPGSRDEARALAVCARCPVRSECLTAAYVEGDQWTIRGGLTADARYALRRLAG